MSLSHTRMHPNQEGGAWTVLVFQQQKERESFALSLSLSLFRSFFGILSVRFRTLRLLDIPGD